MTVFNCYWRIVDQSILPLVATALTITFAGDKFVFHHDLVQALSARVLFGVFLYYLMLRSVMAYFEVDCAERLQTNAITFGLSFPIVTGFHLLELALQQHIENLTLLAHPDQIRGDRN